MTEPEPDFSSIPTPTPLETVAALAAEAAVRAAAEQAPPPAPAPAPPAMPPGLESRLSAIENTLRLLMETPPQPAPLSAEDRLTIDNLRKSTAETARELRLLKEK